MSCFVMYSGILQILAMCELMKVLCIQSGHLVVYLILPFSSAFCYYKRGHMDNLLLEQNSARVDVSWCAFLPGVGGFAAVACKYIFLYFILQC